MYSSVVQVQWQNVTVKALGSVERLTSDQGKNTANPVPSTSINLYWKYRSIVQQMFIYN